MQTESLELTGETDEAALTGPGAYAYDQGWADESYADALLAREANYPAGLDIPTMGFDIAIPHADPGHVTEQAVLLGLPPAGESIAFRSMDNPDERVDAEVVVLLLMIGADGYSSLLSNLAKLFQAEEFAELTKRRDADGLFDLVVERCVDFDGWKGEDDVAEWCFTMSEWPVLHSIPSHSPPVLSRRALARPRGSWRWEPPRRVPASSPRPSAKALA